MSLTASFYLFFSCILVTFLSIARAQSRAPHGLANQFPMAFSPTSSEFFNPNTQQTNTKNPCDSFNCTPLFLTAQVEDTRANESEHLTSQKGGSRVDAGGIAGIVLGFTFVVILAMGVYYVTITRRANKNRGNPVQLDA